MTSLDDPNPAQDPGEQERARESARGRETRERECERAKARERVCERWGGGGEREFIENNAPMTYGALPSEKESEREFIRNDTA